MAKTEPPPAADIDFPTRKKKGNAEGADAEISNLVQSVFFPSAIPVSQAIGFCGVDSGASSSWVCARAGEALAEQLSGSVCLVDANFRHPSLHLQFGIENRLGFADAVRDSRPMERLAKRVWGSKLRLITAGTTGDDADELLISANFQERILELRGRYDYLLFDAPPINLHPDVLSIGPATRGLILVIDGDCTRRRETRAAQKTLEVAQIPILGAVLNKRIAPLPAGHCDRLWTPAARKQAEGPA